MESNSHVVSVSNGDLVRVLGKLERATIGEESDNVIVGCLALAYCLSDPTISSDEEKFRNAIDDTSRYICWVLSQKAIDPKQAN